MFEYFQCQVFEEADDQSFLSRDYSLSCLGARYNQWVPFAILMIMIYPIGIPLSYFVLLHAHRKTVSDPAAMANEVSMGHPTTGHLLFLIEA